MCCSWLAHAGLPHKAQSVAGMHSHKSIAERARLPSAQAQELRASGREPYAYRFARTHMAAELQQRFLSLPAGEVADLQVLGPRTGTKHAPQTDFDAELAEVHVQASSSDFFTCLPARSRTCRCCGTGAFHYTYTCTCPCQGG